MKARRWHQHRVTGDHIFGCQLEAGDVTAPGDVFESDIWRETSMAGEKLTAVAVGTIRYIHPTTTPAEDLGITQAELDALVTAAAESGRPALAALFDRLSPGNERMSGDRGHR
jgi:hypothetical protein